MKVSAEFLNTDNVEVSLTITMPLSSWKALRDDIDPNGHWYPSGKLRSTINDVMRQLEQQVSARAVEP